MRFGKPERMPRALRTRGKAPEQPHSQRPVRPLQPEGLTDESQVAFDPVEGHAHDGEGSHVVALGGDLSGTNVAATVAKLQSVPVAAPASGDDGQFARYNSGSNTITWEAGASHNLLSSTHTDTTAASPTRGDLVTAQGASPAWTRLALGLAGRYLRSNNTDAVWAQIPHTDLTYTGLTAGQVLKASGASAASFASFSPSDLTYSGLTAGQVLKASGATAASFASLTPADLTFSGLTAGHVLRASGASAASFAQLAHTDLGYSGLTAGQVLKASGVSAASFASLTPADLTYSGLTTGQVLRASSATAASFASLSPSDLSYSGLTTGHVLRATGASAASFGQLTHAQLGSVGANDHHNQAHLFFGSDHSDVSGSPGTGALIYRSSGGQWVLLAAGATDQILKMNGSGVPSWAAATSVATARAPMYGWRRSSISTGATTSFTEMPGFDGVNTGERMAYSGTLVGISVVLDGDIGPASVTYVVECYRAISDTASYLPTGVTCTITGASGTQRSASGTGYSVAFNAGDILTVFDKRSSGVNAASAKCHLLVVFD